MKTHIFIAVFFILFSASRLSAQSPVNRHEVKIGLNRSILTTGDIRTFAFQNQYLYGLSPRWGIMGTLNFIHAGQRDQTDLLNNDGFPAANFVNTDYNVVDLEPKLDHQTMIFLDFAPQYRFLIGERHQVGISVGPTIGYFHYANFAVLESGTFISPLGSRDIELIEYRHTRGIDIGGHGRLAYDVYLGQDITLGVQASSHFFANGDFVHAIGVNFGVRL